VRVSPKLGVEAAVEERALEYGAGATFNDVALQETLNRTTEKRTVRVHYDVTPLTTLLLHTESVSDRFEFSPLRDADSTVVIPGVEFKPRALVAGSARVGFRRFRPTTGTLEPFSGIVAALSLSYTLQGATKVTVTADRDLTYSYERDQPYYVVNGVGITVRRQIVGAVDALAGVQRQTYSYRDLRIPGVTLLETERVDRTRTWSGNLGYRLGNTMRAGFGVLYRERSSNSARFRDYAGLRFISTLDYEF
jgi:hypothetical protein